MVEVLEKLLHPLCVSSILTSYLSWPRYFSPDWDFLERFLNTLWLRVFWGKFVKISKPKKCEEALLVASALLSGTCILATSWEITILRYSSTGLVGLQEAHAWLDQSKRLTNQQAQLLLPLGRLFTVSIPPNSFTTFQWSS